MPRILIAIVLLSLFVGPAQATIVSGSLSGTIVGNTYDTYGLFGAAGDNLAGLTVAAGYSYDTALAFSYTVQAVSDSYLGTGNLTLSVTIGGATVATSGVTSTEIIDAAAGADTEVTLANLAPTPLLDFVVFAAGAWVPGVTINAPFTPDAAAEQTIYVSADGTHYDQIGFTASAEQATAAPEPGTLAVVGAGLAGLGAACRRRRSRRAEVEGAQDLLAAPTDKAI